MSTETEKQRIDRELIELLNELKVALPGVQVLFAFLLAVPLNSRFADISDLEKTLFFLTLASTAMATALLIAPSAIHRIDFRNQDKGSMIILFNRISIAGLVFTAFSMIGALMFITDILYGNIATSVVGAISFVVFGLFWFVLPLRRRMKRPDDERLDF
jgi:hypothetical protein